MTNMDKVEPARKIKKLRKIGLVSFGTRKQRFWQALKSACRDYAENTKVHGFFHLRESKGFKRMFWSTMIIISFLIGAVILLNLIEQFLQVPFQITVGNPAPLLSIPFPGISLCHPQTVIEFKARTFMETIKIPDGFNKTEILNMLPTALGIFTENQWGGINANYLGVVNEVMELNHLNVVETVRAVGINCSEFILKCSFNKNRFPCFQIDDHFTFRETMTHVGVCCSFNFNPMNLSYEPMKTNSFGVRGGLSLIGTSSPHTNDGSSGLLFSDGFLLFIHPPYDLPTEESTMALLEVGKITSIGVYPAISTVSDDVLTLPLQSRKCLIGRDVGLKIYRRPACTIRCLRKFIYEKCNCNPYFLPKDDDSKRRAECTVLDGECFQKIYYDMKKIRCSVCLPACEDILYKMSTYTTSYNFANMSINPMYEQTKVSNTEFTAHIYFASSTVAVKKTIISVSLIALLSNLGGVFNLVLGMSVLSIIELLYYFCIRTPLLMRNNDKGMPIIFIIKPASNCGSTLTWPRYDAVPFLAIAFKTQKVVWPYLEYAPYVTNHYKHRIQILLKKYLTMDPSTCRKLYG